MRYWPGYRAVWEAVPFPSPLHSDLHYVYTIDQDARTFTISFWKGLDGLLAPSLVTMNLIRLYNRSSLPKNCLRWSRHVNRKYIKANDAPADSFKTLEIDIGIPTPMNELQEQFFTDFVFFWRSYFDDPLAWKYDSPVFRTLSIGFLRLAAWDFEVSLCGSLDIRISYDSVPRWSYPDADVYWFHGYLIVLQNDIESEAMINGAVAKAESYINTNLRFRRHSVYLIVLSLRRIAFVEISQDTILVSRIFTLLSNHSATQCSPGFRALARVMTSNYWKKHPVYKESSQINVPPEIVHMILHELNPRDTVAFSQASFAAKQCYYASESQFKNIGIQNYKSSIPCCGQRSGLETHGICCSKCYAWQHLECVSLANDSSADQYVCTGCQEGACMVLDAAGIDRFSNQRIREGGRV